MEAPGLGHHPVGQARIVGSIVAALLGLLIPVTMGAETVPWVAWPGFIWLAFVLYLSLILLALEVPMLLAKLWLRRRSRRMAGTTADLADRVAPVVAAALQTASSPENSRPADDPATSTAPISPDLLNPNRRLLLARGAAIFAGLTAGGIVGYGMHTAVSPRRVDRVRIPIANLPRNLDGTRLAVVSDIHLGPIARAAHAQRIVDVSIASTPTSWRSSATWSTTRSRNSAPPQRRYVASDRATARTS